MGRVVGTIAKPWLYTGPIPGTHIAGYVEPPIRKYRVPSVIARMHEHTVDFAYYRMGDCAVFVCREPYEDGLRWHMSVSCEDRHPSWDELKTLRYRLLPHTVDFGIILPRPPEYVNLPTQDHVFHLHEVRDPGRRWTR